MEIPDQHGIPASVTGVEPDLIQKVIGSFGKYQFWLCLLIFLTKIVVGLHQLSILFLAPKVSFTCGTSRNNTCPCSEPNYDTSIYTRTIITEWNLICDKKWLASFTQMLFQLGILVGSGLFGAAGDRFGRKSSLLVAVIIQVSSAIAAAFVTDFWWFTSLRFLIGVSLGGTMVVGFVIIMEFVGAQYRDIVSSFYQMFLNLGHMMLPLFSYYFRDYSEFQLSISVPIVFLLSYFILLPETPRWLITMKRTDEAIIILEHVAKVNKRPIENIRRDVEAYKEYRDKHQLKKGNLLDLFRTPNLRKNILTMSFNWLICGYCFYGVSEYVGQMSGNVLINVAGSAGVTLLGTLASIPIMKCMGRKPLLIMSHLVCFLCLIVLAVLPEGVGSIVCATIAVVSSFFVFIVVYPYCTELFPTVVRNAAIGFSSMLSRIGAMFAPFIIDLRAKALWMPPILFAIGPLIAAIITFALPETKGCELTDTIEEAEQLEKKVARMTERRSS